ALMPDAVDGIVAGGELAAEVSLNHRQVEGKRISLPANTGRRGTKEILRRTVERKIFLAGSVALDVDHHRNGTGRSRKRAIPIPVHKGRLHSRQKGYTDEDQQSRIPTLIPLSCNGLSIGIDLTLKKRSKSGNREAELARREIHIVAGDLTFLSIREVKRAGQLSARGLPDVERQFDLYKLPRVVPNHQRRDCLRTNRAAGQQAD